MLRYVCFGVCWVWIVVVLGACSDDSELSGGDSDLEAGNETEWEIESDGDQSDSDLTDGDRDGMDDEILDGDLDLDAVEEDSEWTDYDIEAESEQEFELEIEVDTEPPIDYAINEALVFDPDPVVCEQPVLVSLGGLSSEGGPLSSVPDANGVMRLQVHSCMDEGRSNRGTGLETQFVCTMHQRADSQQNGSFVYRDYDAALPDAAQPNDPNDIHAEVELYYHASKIYDFITDERVGLFDLLPGQHEWNGEKVPIHLVANYRLPLPVGPVFPGQSRLQSLELSMFISAAHMQVGMGVIYGLEELQGQVLVFGQGESADFAYDGETVYHEFGHLINYALADMNYHLYADEFGMTNQANALEQGMAETFVFLTSERTTLFEYLDQMAGPGYMRDVENDRTYPEALQGVDQFDGLIVTGANYEIFQLLQQNADVDRYDFVRLVMRSLMELKELGPDLTFRMYAESLLQQMEVENLNDQIPAVTEILQARGLFQDLRAKDFKDIQNGEYRALYMGGAIDRMWNTFMTIHEQEQSKRISTAHVQGYVDLSGEQDTLTLSAMIIERSDRTGMYPSMDDWAFELYVREKEPVNYIKQAGDWYEVQTDRSLIPVLSTAQTPSGEVPKITWTISGLSKGERVYLHVINGGDSPAVLAGMQLEVSSSGK